MENGSRPRWVFRMMRGVLYLLGAVALFIALLVAGSCAFCFYVNNWQREEPPSCHESWSAEQRAELLALDMQLRTDKALAGVAWMSRDEDEMRLEKNLWNLITAGPQLLLAWRDLIAPAQTALHEVIASGKGDVCTDKGLPVAYIALKCNKIELVKELVRRGADPNKPYLGWIPPYLSDDPRTNLLADVLEGTAYDTTPTLDKTEKEELLRFMQEHGADICKIPNQHFAGLLTITAIPADEGAGIAWALRHGMLLDESSQREAVRFFLTSHGHTALLNELRHEGLLPEQSRKDTEQEQARPLPGVNGE